MTRSTRAPLASSSVVLEIERQSSVPSESQESLPKEDQSSLLIENHSNIISECADLHKSSSSLSSSWDVEEIQYVIINRYPLPKMIKSLQLPCKPLYDKGNYEEHTKQLIIMEKERKQESSLLPEDN